MFLPDRQSLQIYLYRKPVDMRRERNALAALVKGVLELDPYTGALFVFVGRRRDRVRILYWDRNGFATWYKVLETREKYQWLKRMDVDSVTLTADHASANLFSLAQTCRANGVAPLAYFEHLYQHLPLANTLADLEALLPWRVKALLNTKTTSN